MSTFRKLIIALAVGFIISLVPPTIQNWRYVSNYYGLVVLAGLKAKDTTYNPYSKNFSIVSPDSALWILTHLEYPYRNCPPTRFLADCSEPKINYAFGYYGLVSREGKKRIFSLVNHLHNQGYPVNELSSNGFSALQSHILYQNDKVVSWLLESGADPYLRISEQGPMYGLNAFEFAELLAGKNSERDRTVIENLLAEYKHDDL